MSKEQSSDKIDPPSWESVAREADSRIAQALIVLRSEMSKGQKVKSAIGLLEGTWQLERR